MDPEQLGLQLGIAGALIFAGVKVALVLIANWREAEKERTAAVAAGFTMLVGKVDEHTKADLAAQAEVREDLAHLTSRIDTAFELTPIRPKVARGTTSPGPSGYYGPRKPSGEDR